MYGTHILGIHTHNIMSKIHLHLRRFFFKVFSILYVDIIYLLSMYLVFFLCIIRYKIHFFNWCDWEWQRKMYLVQQYSLPYIHYTYVCLLYWHCNNKYRFLYIVVYFYYHVFAIKQIVHFMLTIVIVFSNRSFT